MADKRKKRGFFDEAFGDNDFDDIEDFIEHMMDKLGFNLEDLDKQPFFYGFSVSGHPGEEPEIREFGNIFSEDDDDLEPAVHQYRVNERRPLMDIFEIEGRVHVTVELCDVEKKDIHINVTETILELKAENEEFAYSESITLPTGVDPDSAKATYNNGVLEVELDIKELGVMRSVSIE